MQRLPHPTLSISWRGLSQRFPLDILWKGGRGEVPELMEAEMTEQIKSATGKTEYKSYGLDCPIARTLDVIGDRWTLLIIRDLLRGTHKYQDLLDSLTGISTNLLAERLARLVDEGLVARTLYTEKPPRAEYHLTEQGQELGAVVDALFEWGTQWRGWGQAPELRTMREYLIRELGLRPEDVREVSEQRTKRTRGLFRA